jgi:hypothetical protein
VATSFDPLKIRRLLGRDDWQIPTPHGPDGWAFQCRYEKGSVIVTCAEISGDEWVHASMAFEDRDPTYLELKQLHYAVWSYGEGHAYQLFVPSDEHVNIHAHALHLWGKLDGSAVLPDLSLLPDGSGRRSI